MKALKRWEKQPADNSKHTMASCLKSKRSELEKHVSDQHVAITECQFHSVAVLPYHWSSWTVYVQQWDWLKGFLLLGTNYDRAWFYDLSSQRPPTLWARSEGSNISIEGLYCTWGQIHTTTEKLNVLFFLKSHVFHRLDLAIQHIANWQQVCMACSFIYRWCLKHRYTVTVRLTGMQHKAIIKY